FLKRAGTFIHASMVVVWFLLYFPSGDYESRIEAEKDRVKDLQEKKEAKVTLDDEEKKTLENAEDEMNRLHMEWKKQSVLGRVGQVIEPSVKPLGWDWRVGMAALASFPAREVMVGTLGIIFGVGKGDMEDEDYRDALHQRLREAGVFSIPVAMSVMVFFALCCQCVSTLVVIKRETNSWGWPIFTFVYMTVLAYIGALVTYQIGSLF
ncbi:MAG TPA: nucleoside recognition domain-containing protein, partial [Gemmataceae bacterium]|nr:nucleoside recognition domain-containing protein [Gemmataceae bacterium]